ncbi:glycosyltransferase [Microbacterium sp. NPDC091313]
MTPSVAIIGTRGYPSFYGGFETAVRYLVPYLAEAGWDVTVYAREKAPSEVDFGERIHVRRTRGVETRSLSTLSYGLTASVNAIRRKPDVALVMNVANGFFLPLMRQRGIPSVVNVDGIEWEREKWGRLARRTFFAGAQLTARYANELVFDANAIGDRWRERWGRDGVFIPYGGEESPGLHPVANDLPRRGYVLAVARFVPENSIQEFLDAAQQLAEAHPVVLVGSSGYGGELEERAALLAREKTNFTWLGHVRDDQLLHSLWQNAGVYFHGHSVGGTNPALVQAMALGAPTLARDTVYNREVLGDAGVHWAQPHEIVDRAKAVLADPALQDRLSAKAVERARSEYSWALVCERYEATLRRVAGLSS